MFPDSNRETEAPGNQEELSRPQSAGWAGVRGAGRSRSKTAEECVKTSPEMGLQTAQNQGQSGWQRHQTPLGKGSAQPTLSTLGALQQDGGQ